MTRRPRPSRGTARVLRGVLFAGMSAGLAIAAHALAGGGMPDTGLIVLLTCLTAAIGTSFATRWHGPAAMIGILAATQLGMHVVLSMPESHTHGIHVEQPAMTVLHAMAVLLTAALLTMADSVLRALTAAVVNWLPRLVSAPHAPARPVILPILGRDPDQALHVLLHRIHSRRGPPAFA